MFVNKSSRNNGFTLLELLIVVGVLAIVGTVTVMILNPSEIFKQSRDALRTTDLKAIDTAIRAYKEYGDIFKTSNIVQADPSNAVIGLVRQDCVGYSNCFTSLAAWVTAFGGINFGSCAQGDLVCANKVAVAKIDGMWSTADTNYVQIAEWITGPNNYIKIYTTSEARHNGRWDDTKYRLETTNQDSLVINEDFVRVEGLQIKDTLTSCTTCDAVSVLSVNNPSDIRISENIVRGVLSGTSSGWGIIVSDLEGDATVYIWNNIVYDFINGSNGRGIVNNISLKVYIYNNTVYNSVYGFYRNSGTVLAKNNISYNNTYNYSGIFNASSTNNLSGPSQTDAPGSNPINAATVQFVNEAGDDFHLSPSDTAARGAGVNLLNDPNLSFSNDIDGLRRFNIWDIGADQLQDIFLSLPDDNRNCTNHSSLPAPPSGWAYRCFASSTFQKVNGIGWIPVDFGKISGNTLSVLPIDPTNESENGKYYTFVTDGKKWELTSIFESDKNKGVDKIGGKDGGQNVNILEIGSNLILTPSVVKSRN
ncbi:MAG: type II secretion system GspH family protein [Candidatus Wolfebacteria bacterium]|nr:type II secretion system GspH family protein [Candidatus Wolfebacteria bacterium]